MTRSKKSIVSVLEKAPHPLSVKQIREKIKTSPIPDIATLYRFLELLVELGMVTVVETGHGHSHYELRGKHHHHVICTKCGKIEEIEVCLPENLKNRVEISSKIKNLQHNLEFYGKCQKCPKKILC